MSLGLVIDDLRGYIFAGQPTVTCCGAWAVLIRCLLIGHLLIC